MISKCPYYAKEMCLLSPRNVTIMFKKLAYYLKKCVYCAQEMRLLCTRNVPIVLKKGAYPMAGNFCEEKFHQIYHSATWC